MDPTAAGGGREGAPGRRKNTASHQGSCGFACPSLLRHRLGLGAEVTRVMLTLSSVLDSSVRRGTPQALAALA